MRVCMSVQVRGGQLRTRGTVTRSIFKLRGGEKAAALEPVTGRGVRGDSVRFKDAQDRCVVWALSLGGLHAAGRAHIWRPGCLSLQPPARHGGYK